MFLMNNNIGVLVSMKLNVFYIFNIFLMNVMMLYGSILICWGVEWNNDLKGRELKYLYLLRMECFYFLVFVCGIILEWYIIM